MYCYVALSDLTSVVTGMAVCVSSVSQTFGIIQKSSNCQDCFCVTLLKIKLKCCFLV